MLFRSVFEDNILTELQKQYSTIAEPLLSEIKDCVRQVDWFNHASTISGLKMGIRKQLKSAGTDKDIENKVEDVVNLVFKMAKEVSSKE